MASKLIYPVVAAVGIAAASGVAWWVQNKPKPASSQAKGGGAPAEGAAKASASGGAVSVEVAQVQTQRLRDDAESVGSLRSRQAVMLRPEVAGRVKELGFADGASVRRGQLLVQLDDTLQRAELRQAAAQVSIAQANFKRNQELVSQGFVAQRVLDESSASLQVAEAQLALGCARFMRMAIVAPFDGTVGMRNVNLGDYVKDGADLINLEDTSSMYVDFRLPERFQGKLQVRQSVELQIDALPGRTFRATVEAIDPLLDVNGRSVGVRAVLPNTSGEAAGAAKGAKGATTSTAPTAATAATVPAPARAQVPGSSAGAPAGRALPARAAVPMDGCPAVETVQAAAQPSARGVAAGPLRPGMFARVTTVFAVRESALVIPEEAIVPQGGQQFVIKAVAPQQGVVPASTEGGAKAPQQSQRQRVVLGVRQLGKVEVLEGLREGDTVVVAGHQRLQRDGTPLRIVPAGGGTRPERPSPAGPATPGGEPGSSTAPVKADSGVVPVGLASARSVLPQ